MFSRTVRASSCSCVRASICFFCASRSLFFSRMMCWASARCFSTELTFGPEAILISPCAQFAFYRMIVTKFFLSPLGRLGPAPALFFTFRRLIVPPFGVVPLRGVIVPLAGQCPLRGVIVPVDGQGPFVRRAVASGVDQVEELLA